MAPLRAAARNAGWKVGQCPSTCDNFQMRAQRGFRSTKPKRAGPPPEGDGISHNIEYSGVWGYITTFPKRQPFYTNLIVATLKTSFADLLVQKGEGRDRIDWSRNAVFTAFGFAYLGVAQWFIYVTVFVRLCPNAIRFANLPWAAKLKDRAGQIDLVKQTIYDNFVHYTFIYFPVFYCFKEALQADTGDKSKSLPERALGKYWNNFVMDNLYIWALWIPGDLAVYACPIWMRLPLNHGVSFIWTIILSSLRGGEK